MEAKSSMLDCILYETERFDSLNLSELSWFFRLLVPSLGVCKSDIAVVRSLSVVGLRPSRFGVKVGHMSPNVPKCPQMSSYFFFLGGDVLLVLSFEFSVLSFQFLVYTLILLYALALPGRRVS